MDNSIQGKRSYDLIIYEGNLTWLSTVLQDTDGQFDWFECRRRLGFAALKMAWWNFGNDRRKSVCRGQNTWIGKLLDYIKPQIGICQFGQKQRVKPAGVLIDENSESAL